MGYQTAPLASANYTMISIPFVHVANDGKGLMLNEDIKVAGVKGDADAWTRADQIWVWQPSKNMYDKFFYYDDKTDAGWAETVGEWRWIQDVPEYKDGIPSTYGMYFVAKDGEKSITFTSPLAK